MESPNAIRPGLLCPAYGSQIFFEVGTAFNIKVRRMSVIANVPQDKMDCELSAMFDSCKVTC